MRLTNFNSVVDTYKENFLLRKKKFFNDKNQVRNEKRKEREENIETVKAIEPLIKTSTEKSTKPKNFLGGIYKFLGFALAGLLLSNLDSIISIASEIYKKIKELKEGIENFVTSIQDTIDSFYSGFESFKQDLDDLLSPITSADLSGIVPFQEELEKVLTATLNVVDKIFEETTGRDPERDFSGRDEGRAAFRDSNIPAGSGTKQSKGSADVPKNNENRQKTPSEKAGQGVALGAAALAVTSLIPIAKGLIQFGSRTTSSKTSSPGSGVSSPKPTSPFQLEQARNKLTRTKLYRGFKFPKFKAPDIPKSSAVKPPPLLSSVSTPSTSSSAIKPGIKSAELLKNMRSGIVNPGNLRYLRSLGTNFIVGSVLDYVAMNALNKGLEFVGIGNNAITQRGVKKYIESSDDAKKQYLKRLNNELKKQIDYQKSATFVVEKIITIGGETNSDRMIKTYASILASIAALSGGNVLSSDINSADLPESFRHSLDRSSPFSQPTTSLISGLPPLPPTNTLPGGVQSYGASRSGGFRKHAGQDFDPADDKNSKFYSRIGGEVIFAGNVGGGYGNVVDIFNKELGYTERIAEGDRIHVKVGDIVEPGTLVQSGSEMTGVFHYEIRKGKAGKSGSFKGTVNPLEFLKNLKPPEEVSMRTPASNLTSSAGLNQPTTYSEGGVAVRREVNNIIIPIAA